MSEQKVVLHILGIVAAIAVVATAVLSGIAVFSAHGGSGQTTMSITPKLTSSHYMVVLPNATAKPSISAKAAQTHKLNPKTQLHTI